MDMKIKIIIVIFVAIAFMYVGHFIINYMSTKTKQESVSEEFNDIEHYEEPVQSESKESSSSSPGKYDQRILILDDIEKLDISNKDIKGKLMEKLFDDSAIKTISEMTASQRSTFIKDQLAELNKSFAKLEVPPENKPEPPPKPELKQEKKTEQLDFDPSSLVSKTQETIKSLQSVQDGLKEIHKIAESFKPQKETMSFKEPYIPSTALIEGFENMRSYAPLL